jgi:ABC-2 type transport system ATP-binding protein
VLAEVQQTVDDVVIIARGRLVQAGPLAGLGGVPGTEVASPEVDRLREALQAEGLSTNDAPGGRISVLATEPARVGAIAHREGVELHHLAPANTDLEQAFLRLVADAEAQVR